MRTEVAASSDCGTQEWEGQGRGLSSRYWQVFRKVGSDGWREAGI